MFKAFLAVQSIFRLVEMPHATIFYKSNGQEYARKKGPFNIFEKVYKQVDTFFKQGSNHNNNQ